MNKPTNKKQAPAVKKKKERKPAEDSIFLRILWLAQTMVCFWLIYLADPNGSCFTFGAIKIPLLIIYFWVSVVGSYLSYYYRHQNVKWLEWLGLGVIAGSCYCFVENLKAQTMGGGDIDLLTPTAHLVAGLYVSHSFELRARFDFNFSLVLGMLLVFATATLGKGWIFGLAIFSYVILSAVLLLLDCESRTFGAVQARKFEELDPYLSFNEPQNEKTANLVFPTATLLAVSIAFFLVAPRAESFADQITARVYSFIKKQREGEQKQEKEPETLAKRLRTPFLKLKDRKRFMPSEPEQPKPEENKGQENKPEENAKSGEKDKGGEKNKNGEKNNGGEKSGERNKNGTTQNKNNDGQKNASAQNKNDAENKNAANQKKNAGEQNRESSKEQKNADSKEKESFKRQKIDLKSLSRSERKKRQEEQSTGGSSSTQNGKATQNAVMPPTSGGPNLAANPSKQPSKPNSASNNNQNKPDANKPNPKKPDEAKNQTNGSNSSGKNNSSPANKQTNPSAQKTDSTKPNQSSSQNGGQSQNSSKQNSGQADPNSKQTADSPKTQNTSPPKQPKQGRGQQATKKIKDRYDISDSMNSQQAASQTDELIFTVTSNRTVFFRQAAYDFYDGRNWKISPDLSRADLQKVQDHVFNLGNAFPLALPEKVPAIKLNQKYHMNQNLGDKIVISGNPIDITFPGPGITLDSCGNLRGQWALVNGIEYSVASDEPMYDIQEMRDDGVPTEVTEQKFRADLQAFLQIPDTQSQDLVDLAERTVGLQDNWFVQAEKICNLLRKNYKYTLDPSVKGDSTNGVDRFLFETKAGDCKDFASSFVIMCRSVGIPARMVFGYNPGDFDPLTGTRQIRPKNAHAWGEVFVPEYGWVPFDATPQGIMPAREKEQERYFTTLQQQVESSLKKVELKKGEQNLNGKQDPNGPKVITNDPRYGPKPGELSQPGPAQKTQTQKNGWQNISINLWDVLKLVPALLAVAVLVGPLLLFVKDLAKTIKLPKKIHPASKVLKALQKDFKSYGVTGGDSVTAGEFLDKLRNRLSEAEAPNVDPQLDASVEDFVNTYNAVFFGQRGSVKELEQKRQRIKKLL